MIMSIITLKILKKPWVMIIDGISPSKIDKGNYIIDNFKKFMLKDAKCIFC